MYRDQNLLGVELIANPLRDWNQESGPTANIARGIVGITGKTRNS